MKCTTGLTSKSVPLLQPTILYSVQLLIVVCCKQFMINIDKEDFFKKQIKLNKEVDKVRLQSEQQSTDCLKKYLLFIIIEQELKAAIAKLRLNVSK